MPKFSYTAMDARGNETSGEIEVENTAAAISKIKEMGYYPTPSRPRRGSRWRSTSPA